MDPVENKDIKKEELLNEPEVVEGTKEKGSILYLLPKGILKELNDAIDKDAKISELRAFLRERYQGALKVHSEYLVRAYIKQYKQEKQNAILGKQVLQTTKEFKSESSDILHSVIKNKTWDINNKREILQDLISECKNRIDILKTKPLFQQGPGNERALAQYISEIREIVKMLAELSGELETGNNNTTINLINDKLYYFFSAVANVAKELYGDEKLILFKERLKQTLLEGKKGLKMPEVIEIKQVEIIKEKNILTNQLEFEECKIMRQNENNIK